MAESVRETETCTKSKCKSLPLGQLISYNWVLALGGYLNAPNVKSVKWKKGTDWGFFCNQSRRYLDFRTPSLTAGFLLPFYSSQEPGHPTALQPAIAEGGETLPQWMAEVCFDMLGC